VPVIHLRIAGRVQGVGFRWFVREHAFALGLAGWVRNTADGEVELAASGDEASLAALAAEVGRGPPGAYVRTVRRIEPAAELDYPDPFRIAP